MGIFRTEKIFIYNDINYSYEELKDLKIKFPQFAKEGDVINTETGRVESINNFERFYNDSIQENNYLMKTNAVPTKTQYEVNRKLTKDNSKRIIGELYEKIKDESISYEDINYYWELKQPLQETIIHNYKMKDFIKVSTYEDKSKLLKEFSLIDKGRILELIDLVSYDCNIIKDREFMMDKLEFTDSEMFRRFMKKLDDNEIVFRLHKQNKKDVTFVLNPFIFTKHTQRELNIELYEMFPKSFKIFLPLDVYTYFKLKHDKEFIKININNYY